MTAFVELFFLAAFVLDNDDIHYKIPGVLSAVFWEVFDWQTIFLFQIVKKRYAGNGLYDLA